MKLILKRLMQTVLGVTVGLILIVTIGVIIDVKDDGKLVEPTLAETVDYVVNKNLVQNDPSSYSGKTVYEISLYGEFDIKDEDIKEGLMEILELEGANGLKEQPNSEMIRVFIYQGSEADYEMLPVGVATFDVVEGELKIQKLNDKARFPIFNTLK